MLSRRTLLAAGAATVVAACSDPRRSAPTTVDPTTVDPTTVDPTTVDPTTTSGPVAAAEYFPATDGEWETIDPVSAGFTAAGLSELADLAGASNSTTLTMLIGGRIVAENYFAGSDVSTLRDVASVQKSVASTLIGIARDQGLLDFDDPVSDYLPAGWSQATRAEEAAITLRHLMTMTSGLNPRLRKQHEPGTTFEYNTEAYQKLLRVLEAASGMELNDLTRIWLFDAIGVQASAGWALRPSIVPPDATGQQPWGLKLTARDMARFGLLALRGGRWNEAQVTPPGWFAEAWTSSPVQRDYGLLWWLIGRGRRGGPQAPSDWVAALGASDQKIFVIPSLDLVLTRQGDAAREASEAGSSFDAELIGAVLAARV